MKKVNLLFLAACFVLAGCYKDQSVAYERVALNQCNNVVYFRNCLVARSFNTLHIGVFKGDHIEFSAQQWKVAIVNQMFNHVLIESAKKGIKITKLPNFTCVDCFIEHIFYDQDKREAVMSFTINFSGKIKPFYVVHSVSADHDVNDLQELFTVLFQKAGEEIAEFLVKNMKK